MASYSTIKNGSQGNDVKTWQNYLISQGYNLGNAGADGIFGSKTLAATKAYQKANGLTIDGIVGKNTWGSMKTTTPKTTTKTTTAKTTTPKTTTTTTKNTTPTFTYDDFEVSKETTTANNNRQTIASQKPSDFTYADYEESDLVKQAKALLEQTLASKPGEYQSAWQPQLDEAINKILNREKFTYDLNGDALYQQYKDQYVTQGNQAMMDTMGQAAAMTGGYGSSYGQSVGQQTYQGYLQQLNNKIPELYQLALDQYNREGDELYNQYGLLSDRENQDYGRYRDTVTDWQTDRSYYTDLYGTESDRDYGRYVDGRDFAYGQHRDTVTDWQYDLNRADSEYWNLYNRDYTQYTDDREFAFDSFVDNRDYIYKAEQDAIANDLALQTLNESIRSNKADEQYKTATLNEDARQFNIENGVGSNTTGNTNNTTGNTTSPNNTGGGYDTHGYTTEQIKALQTAAGITADGIWGANTQKAYEDGYRPTSIDASEYEGDNVPTSTYSHAYDYAISEGVPKATAAGIMTEGEWLRHGKPNGKTYEEYVDNFIEKNKPKKQQHR